MKGIRALLLNTFDIEGGAAIATHRLHRALRRSGVESWLYVQSKSGDDADVLSATSRQARIRAWLRPRLDQLRLRPYPDREPLQLFSPGLSSHSLASIVTKVSPDIVHLSWIARGFLSPENIRAIDRPIVWTLHDMWPFTGGCHYDSGCGRYLQRCGACPQLHSRDDRDISRRVWQRKQDAWRDLPMTIVTPSRWLGECARGSALFRNCRVEVIPNGIDVALYKPIDKAAARSLFNLPLDRKLILLSAEKAISDPRKGYQHLVPALRVLADQGWADRAELMIVGSSRPADAPDLGMRVHYLGRLRDEASRVAAYSCADVSVTPSTQENLSNTVMESMACGVPVVAFGIGGMPDMISHGENGYLATPFEHADLARGIAETIGDEVRHRHSCSLARHHVLQNYDSRRIAERHLALYEDILGRTGPAASVGLAD